MSISFGEVSLRRGGLSSSSSFCRLTVASASNGEKFINTKGGSTPRKKIDEHERDDDKGKASSEESRLAELILFGSAAQRRA